MQKITQPQSSQIDNLAEEIKKLNAPLEAQAVRICTTISNLSQQMEAKLLECDAVFTAAECKELDKAYDRGIELVEKLIAQQQDTIRRLARAKERENNWKRLEEQTLQTDSKVNALLKQNPVLDRLIKVELEIQRIEQLLTEIDE